MADDITTAARERCHELDEAPHDSREVLCAIARASGLLDSAHGDLRLIVGGIPTRDTKDHGNGPLLAHARYLTEQALATLVPLFGMDGAERIAAERRRQVEVEGYLAKHDDPYRKGELILAACCYAHAAGGFNPDLAPLWPWPPMFDKRPSPDADTASKIRALEKAGALIAAEIDRRLRLAPPVKP